MAPIARIWAYVTYVVNYFTFSPSRSFDQAPILSSDVISYPGRPKYPIFQPPGHAVEGPGSEFQCEYPSLVGWRNCSTAANRTCWLRNDATGQEYNLWTNYEDIKQTPVGIIRNYTIDVTDEWINADGRNFSEAKLLNKTYPGPWIQGCWGDTISVKVNNKLKHNGTSIHWHGIRQWLTMHMDGVNGVTQCPIAPNDSFTYTWKAMQYGSAWYHSHYSVQYADGALGPLWLLTYSLTLHGPSSKPYDEAKPPILMTDWGHNSAFNAMYPDKKLQYASILLNGRGNITRFNHSVPADLPIPQPHNITFDGRLMKGEDGKPRHKRYLLRVINTAFDSTFVFSIDNHMLTVVGADFVPINSYTNESILVGIGQRYHVIVEAKPNLVSPDGNYWIRTWKADCFGFNNTKSSPGYEKAGILRYNEHSRALPSTRAWTAVPLRCSDEEYKNLVPVIPWTVGEPANGVVTNDNNTIEKFSVTFGSEKSSDAALTMFPTAYFSMGGDGTDDEFIPLRVDYANPTFMNLNNTGRWNPQWVVIPENFTDTDWVYMVIKGRKLNGKTGAHPIHLHGHDFAILQQKENATFPDGLSLKKNNPPRRDVVLLPTNGYVVIAFKTDNPGAWLVHCHIADHASWGLAMQIMERQQDAANIWPSLKQSPALRRAEAGCEKWNEWWSDCHNWWHGKDEKNSCKIGEMGASPDSGI